jgi:NADH-ubiquinone oxidoreductase chain 4
MGADIFFYDSLRYSYFLLNIFGNDIFFVVDGYSFIFLFLTALLVPVCVLVGWESIKNDFFLYNIMIFLSIFILNIVFLVVDLLVFFIFFELLMIPLFF